MLYRETIAVCSEIHTKHRNTMWGQNVESVNVKPGGIGLSGRAVCGRSPAGIVGSNPTGCMDVCLL